MRKKNCNNALAAVSGCPYLFISTLCLVPYDKLPFCHLLLTTLDPTPHLPLVSTHSIAWSVHMYPYIYKLQSNAQGTPVEFTWVLPWSTRLPHWWYLMCPVISGLLLTLSTLLILIWSNHQWSPLSWLHHLNSTISVVGYLWHSQLCWPPTLPNSKALLIG